MPVKNSTCCAIFTKTPEVGKTKTRLIPCLGKTGANNLHIKLLEHCLANINTSLIDFQLHYTASTNIQYIETLAIKYNIKTKQQYGSDLGQRMFHASQKILSSYSQCIIIGTDCPDMSSNYILSSKKILSTGIDIVLGPADDGGYVLIGLNKTCPDIFNNIKWGCSQVLQQTKLKISQVGWTVTELDSLHDIDTEDDLKHLKNTKIKF